MRTCMRHAVPVFALWALSLMVGVAQAQDEPKAGDDLPKAKAGTTVFAFFSSSAEFPLTGEPKKDAPTYLTSISTRLNTENYVFAYIYNPSARDQSVNVFLQAGDDKSRVVVAQTGGPVLMGAKEIRKVALASTKTVAATPPAAPPAPPVAGEKLKELDPDALIPRGDKLPAGARNLYLRVVPSTAKLDVLGLDADALYNINTKAPDDFTPVVTATDRAITVVLKYKAKEKRLSTTPVKVRLDLRADMNPGLLPASALEGTFVAELPALDVGEEATATLVAKNLVFSPIAAEKLTFAVTVDGYDRAFLYETDFKGSEPLPIGNKEKAVTNVRLSSTAQVPGKPVTITVEADGTREVQSVELLINRLGDGTPTEVMRKFPTFRNREVYLLVGDDGAVTLTPVVKDWTVEFPTAQVAGKRAFAVRVESATSPKQVLTVDRTPPTGVAFVDVPPKPLWLVSKELDLFAVGTDDDSGVAGVYFFTGETPPGPDGKPAAGSRVIPGVEVKGKPATYKTKEPLRLPEAKGELRLGVIFYNKVGLSFSVDRTEYVSVPVVAGAGADKPTTGSIIGRAVQAGRPQPGLPVGLLDAAGKVVKETKSDDTGKFEFKELAPGNYTVVAVKKIDANATGKATVEVKAAKEPTQIPALVIKR